jgi:hypothetical protein
MQQRINAAAAAAGRDPASIQRIYNIVGRIRSGPAAELFNGPVEHWVDELTRLVVDQGMDTFMLALLEPPENQLERFMAEIAPRVRENVAAQRVL